MTALLRGGALAALLFGPPAFAQEGDPGAPGGSVEPGSPGPGEASEPGDESTAAEEERGTWDMLAAAWDRLPPREERELPWLQGEFNIWSGLASAAILGVSLVKLEESSAIGGLGDQGNDFEEFGDNIFKLPSTAAYLTSIFAGDFKGTAYMGLHNAISSGVMQIGKDAVGQRRPGDQDSSSYPSGHANTAFIGASFLQQRYGPRWGVPGYLTASVVAASRVHGNKHYVHDVISGATIAMISSWLFVPPYEKKRRDRWKDLERERPWRYEWGMSLNDIPRNRIQAPRGQGDLFDSPIDEGEDEPWVNVLISLEHRFNDRQAVIGTFAPWEIRSFGSFSQPTTFGGQTFPAGEQLRSAHTLWNFGAQYRHAVVKNDRVEVRVGGGLAGQYADYELFVVDPSQPESRGQTGRASTTDLYFVGHEDLDVGLFWKLYFAGDIDYGTAGSSDYLDWRAFLKLRFNTKWDLGVGWTDYAATVDESDLVNDFRRQGVFFNVGYSF